MFCDQTKLILKAGDGGNGCVSFRREKYIPRGGPNGGNGGKGGDIFFVVNDALNSLVHLDTYKQFKAPRGDHGKGDNRAGRAGDDLELEVPLGTMIFELKRDEKGKITQRKLIADLSSKNKRLLVCKGGRGGYGNAHFASSVRQAPKFAELGEPGEEIEVELELKLVADIGIIGIPSAGKSSLISVISNARPKIADYPFTTLIPNLGVVKITEKETYVVADIPGLIEKAHEGKGLGMKFLKHVQRCRLLVHLIDPLQGSLAEKPKKTLHPAIDNFHLINKELKAFSKELSEKSQIVIINKSDVTEEKELKKIRTQLKKICEKNSHYTLYPEAISAATTSGIKDLKYFLFQELQQRKNERIEEPKTNVLPSVRSTVHTSHLYTPHLDNPKYFSIEQIDKGVFQVSGQRIEQIVSMTNQDNTEALHRVFDVLKKMGISRELKKQGIKDGDTLIIGEHEFEYTHEE